MFGTFTCSLVAYFLSVLLLWQLGDLCRTRAYQREERNLGTFLTATADKWVPSCYEVKLHIVVPHFKLNRPV